MPNVLLHYSKHQRPRTQQLALQHPALLTRAQKATQPITPPQTAPVTSQTQLFATSKPRLWLSWLQCTFCEGVLQTGVVPRYFVRLGRCTVSAFGFAKNLSKLSPIVINKLLLLVDLSNNSLDLSMSLWIFRWAGEKFELTVEQTPIIGVTR